MKIIIKNFINTIRSYTAIIKWIIRDLFVYLKWPSIKALSAGIIGVTTLVGAIGITIYYIKLLENNEKIVIFNIDYNVSSSLTVLIIFAIFVLFSMLTSSVLQYYSRKKIYEIRKDYDIFCSKRALNIIMSSVNLRIPKIAGLPEEKSILRIVRGDASYCGRIIQMVLEGITPGITFIVALAPLISINFVLTVCIGLLLIFSIFFHYRNNIHGARMSSIREDEIGGATKEFIWLIRQIINLGLNHRENYSFIDKHFLLGATQRFWKAIQARRITTEKSKLISNIFFSIIFFILIITFGWNTIVNNNSLTKIVLYVISMRYFLVNFQNVVAKITSINRFYPHFKRYYKFIELNQDKITRDNNSSGFYEIVSKALYSNKSLSKCNIKNNAKIGILCNKELNKLTVKPIIESLFSVNNSIAGLIFNEAYIITGKIEKVDASIRGLLGLPQSFTNNDFISELKKINLKYDESLNIEQFKTSEQWANISSEAKMCMISIVGSYFDYKLNFFDADTFYSISDDMQKNIMRYLDNGYKLFIHNKINEKIFKETYDLIIILDVDNKKILEINSAKDVHYEKANHLFNSIIKKKKEINNISIADLDDEDEMDLDDM